jgi:hypothetical protein
MPEKKSGGVQKWISGIVKSVERPPTPPTPHDYVDNGEKEGEWVNRVPSLMLGEDCETRDEGRPKSRIDAWRSHCDELQKAGPFENDSNEDTNDAGKAGPPTGGIQ